MSDTEAALRAKFAPALPDAIKRQVESVNQLVSGAATPDGAQAAPAGGQDAPGTEAATAASAEAGGGESQPMPSAQSATATPPADAGGDTLDSLRAKITQAENEARTWKGRERKTREEMEAFQARLADLERKLAEATKAPEPKALDPLSSEDIETYGQDVLDAALRYVMPHVVQHLTRALEPLTGRLDGLENKTGRVAAEVAKTEWESFLDTLTARVPNWREIDNLESFKVWLDSPDELLGVERRSGLDSAVNARDLDRVARFFETFARQGGDSAGSQSQAKGASPAPGTEVRTTPTAPVPVETGPSLEDFAAPGRPATSPPTAPPIVQSGAKIWQITEIAEYYRARTQPDHPHYRDRAKAAAMDAEIANAQREGRVRGP